jgi:hypothetical protein
MTTTFFTENITEVSKLNYSNPYAKQVTEIKTKFLLTLNRNSLKEM